MSAVDRQALIQQIETLLPTRPAEALLLADQALSCRPADEAFQVRRARALLDLGRPDVARLQIEAILLVREPDTRLLLLLARASARMGDHEACRVLCEQVLRDNPTHRHALMLMLQSMADAGRISEALHEIDRRLDDTPTDPELLWRRALLLRRDGQLGEAVAAFRTALNLLPEDRRLRLGLADTLAQFDDAAAALDVLGPMLAETPEDADLMLRRIRFLRFAAQQPEARNHADLATARHPQDMRLWLELALLCRQLEDPKAGLVACNTALALEPEHAAAQREHLELLIQQGDRQQISAVAWQAANALTENLSNPPSAWALSSALPSLPAETLRDALRLAMPGLVASAETLPDHLLWQTCLHAEPLGFGTDAGPLLAQVLSRPKISFAVVRAMTMHLFAAESSGWPRRVAPLAERLSPAERGIFICEVVALEHGADAALAVRPRDPKGRDPAHLRTARLILLARLLRQTGRVKLAARHQLLVLRRQRLDPTLFRMHLSTLLQAGYVSEARALLRRIDAEETHGRWPMIVAQSWGDMDQPERACRMAGRLPKDTLRSAAQIWYPRCLLRLGRAAEARTLFDGMRDTMGLRHGSHFGPSIEGVMQTEAELGVHDDGGSDTLLVTSAIRRINAAAPLLAQGSESPADVPEFPAKIMQYWHSPDLPRDVARITESWARLRGYRYQRFNKSTALQFLEQHFDRDWLLAFRKARSATEESDFFRLCWLAVEGGIYADCDDWRTGHPRRLLSRGKGLILLREPVGATANNFIAAQPRHPAILWAAVAARRALTGRHNDSVWSKTGPGLLTRAAAWYLEDCARKGVPPALTILPQLLAGLVFDPHVPLDYKNTSSYWNASHRASDEISRLGPLLEELANRDEPDGAQAATPP